MAKDKGGKVMGKTEEEKTDAMTNLLGALETQNERLRFAAAILAGIAEDMEASKRANFLLSFSTLVMELVREKEERGGKS